MFAHPIAGAITISVVLSSLVELQNLKRNVTFASQGEVRFVATVNTDKKTFLTVPAASELLLPVAKAAGDWKPTDLKVRRHFYAVVMPCSCLDHNQDLEGLGCHLQLPAETMHKLQSSAKRNCSHRSSCCGMQGLESLSGEQRPEFFREFKVAKKLAADFDKKHPPPDPKEAAAASPARKKRKGAAKDEEGGGGGAEKEPEKKPAAKRARRGPKKEEGAGEAGEEAAEEVDDAAQRGVTKVHSKCA